MQLSSQQTLDVPREDAWNALNDITVLQACIPGCESFNDLGEGRYEVTMMAAVGPVKARFKGKLALTELQPPTSYTIHFEGQGGAAGHGKGSARVRLEPAGARQTVLHYEADATVGGKIAQIGQRLVDMAAQRMAADFFSRFDEQLRAKFPSPPEAQEAAVAQASTPPGASWWQRLLLRLRRAFA